MEKTNTPATRSLIGGRTELKAKLWPNGEIAIWKARTFKPDPLPAAPDADDIDRRMSMYRLGLHSPAAYAICLSALGLSPLPIFDKSKWDVIEGVEGVPVSRAPKGSNGITAYGKRMVRNAAELIEKESGYARTIFATCTVPPLPIEQMTELHERWHDVVDYYRIQLRRSLKDKGLSGESVTVTEIQEHRYHKTGLPILHIHSVFCGVTNIGRYALTLKQHDDMWFRALNTVVDIERHECAHACNLQRVKKSASGYLAKYITKGAAEVKRCVENGFARWLPKHWWNCTRSLMRRVKSQVRDISAMAEWLNAAAEVSGNSVWKWHRDVLIEMYTGDTITIARYGQLTKEMTKEIAEALRPC